jgi:hypothetical protein
MYVRLIQCKTEVQVGFPYGKKDTHYILCTQVGVGARVQPLRMFLVGFPQRPSIKERLNFRFRSHLDTPYVRLSFSIMVNAKNPARGQIK